MFTSPNVIYLESTDLNPATSTFESSQINPRTGKPYFSEWMVVLVQGSYCGYCTQFKPIFQQLADDMAAYNIPVEFATIEIDGKEPGEAMWQSPEVIGNILGQPLQGVPTVVRMYKGRVVDMFSGERNYQGLVEYVTS